MGTLFVVATPIGNLEDLSPRAIRTLCEVSLIAAEDTRHSRILLNRFGIATKLVSYHAFNERERVNALLQALDNGDVALVSDAGTPGISDPGSILVRAVVEAGFDVRPIPGPSSLGAAMSISGFSEDPSIFLGFLPRKKAARRTMLETALSTGFHVFCFESPQRVVRTLEEIDSIWPGRTAVVFRELTKVHEEILRGSVDSLIEQLRSRVRVRGEVVIGIEGARPIKPDIDIGFLLGLQTLSGMWWRRVGSPDQKSIRRRWSANGTGINRLANQTGKRVCGDAAGCSARFRSRSGRSTAMRTPGSRMAA
jgi:16S rRNA (cytidine1402-2'-O)-methyltransferase